LACASARAAADAVIARGLKAHRRDADLVLVGARLRFEAGDLAGARAMLVHGADGIYSLSQRLAVEELLAEVADRAGDAEAAVLARARARMLGRRLKESSFNPGEEPK
jgi:hypothetical protein